MEDTLILNAEIKQKTSANLVLLFIICFAGNMFGGVISTLMSVYLPVVVKELQGNKSTAQLNDISGFINSMFIFGWAAGGFLWGIVGDWAGRKKSLLLSIFGYAVFTMLTGLMQSWWGIVLCRFMSGFGMGGLLVISFTLVSETNALLFTPMLAEVAGSSLEPSHISTPLRTSLRRTQVVRGKVSEVELESRKIRIAAEGGATM